MDGVSVASYFMYHWTPWGDEPMKAHCMGMEFPKRDTDSPNVRWVPTTAAKLYADRIVNDLNLYTERIKEKTSAKVPNR